MNVKQAMNEIYGSDWRENLDDILGEIMSDCASPAYCTNAGCFYYEDSLEPDAHGCTCDDCGTDTVQSVVLSCLALALFNHIGARHKPRL